jgi:hypothetical protein
MPEFSLGLVALGAFGGILPDAIRFARNRQQGFPGWFRKIGYWVGLAVLVALGALAAWLGKLTMRNRLSRLASPPLRCCPVCLVPQKPRLVGRSAASQSEAGGAGNETTDPFARILKDVVSEHS